MNYTITQVNRVNQAIFATISINDIKAKVFLNVEVRISESTGRMYIDRMMPGTPREIKMAAVWINSHEKKLTDEIRNLAQ